MIQPPPQFRQNSTITSIWEYIVEMLRLNSYATLLHNNGEKRDNGEKNRLAYERKPKERKSTKENKYKEKESICKKIYRPSHFQNFDPLRNEATSRQMAAEHEPRENGNSSGLFGKGSFIFGITTLSLFAGFGLTLGRVRKKNPTEFGELGATKLALKALGIGTVLSIAGCGFLVLATKWALGVRNVEEFSLLMTGSLPSKDGDLVQKFEKWRIPRKSSADDVKEWEDAISK
ncbi:uncharacterized protein LOC135685826 [Rhopilema esculentum]|uniref:uncharacterized protein LOC135685826 n=1 Tax=Rhopilema esculentum TaxID=499914 RepID=UPI0031DAAF03|eukprot:gene17570-9202_t